MRMLDLFSGLGGASEAFVRSSGDDVSDVIRVDNDPVLGSIPHTRVLNALHWMDWIVHIPRPVEVIWASPPCQEFSQASNQSTKEPSLRLLQAALDIIDHLEPKWWIVENVRGAVKHFRGELGTPTQVIGPFYLWGRFPPIAVNVERLSSRENEIHLPANSPERKGRWVFNGKKYHKWGELNKATIPFEISKGLLDSILEQRTLGDYI